MNPRSIALQKLHENIHYNEQIDFENIRISEIFGINVFTIQKMQRYISSSTYAKVLRSIETGAKISRIEADEIANGMKKWAIERGATHFTHWFQPLTGNTAEKHDSFLAFDNNKLPFESFDGSKLVQQEPDASSFPSGGIRNTFEARGYTAWDPTSPAFIIGDTLCIPTIFIAYTGESLDYKTPLLKTLEALNSVALPIVKLFRPEVKKVYPTLGWEQEYFLVDEALFLARPDLVLTGRTLMGHASARDQQLNDHYFGSIPLRVKKFMQELEIEAYKLGIPLKTRHNEVAPGQFELAPIYEHVNLAVDHNQIIMALMQEIAKKHRLRVLLHEKPFKGINGSGKHNNWSLMTDTGINLLQPCHEENGNLLFLIFLVNTIKAVYEFQDLLRASILTPGNAHRLGGHEAPPSIISIFVGKYLTQILAKLEKQQNPENDELDDFIKLDVANIPEILLDNTDRNRTSPFAFTGNRFEFRAVGASANCASPMIAINAALTYQLRQFKDELYAMLNRGIKKETAIIQILSKYIKQAKNILFEGNNYSQQWIEEAKKRGLSNIKDVPSALQTLIENKTIEMFESINVLTKRELNARYNILIEDYILKTQIEVRVLGDLAVNHIIPIALKYQNLLLENIAKWKEVAGKDADIMSHSAFETAKNISLSINAIKDLVSQMHAERQNADNISDIRQKAFIYANKIEPFLYKIREKIDELELIIDDEYWTLPKYRELLFLR